MSQNPAAGVVTGYRVLDDAELAFIARIKRIEAEMERFCTDLDDYAHGHEPTVTIRWASLARTKLEDAFHYANKVVARPTMSIGRRGSGAES